MAVVLSSHWFERNFFTGNPVKTRTRKCMEPSQIQLGPSKRCLFCLSPSRSLFEFLCVYFLCPWRASCFSSPWRSPPQPNRQAAIPPPSSNSTSKTVPPDVAVRQKPSAAASSTAFKRLTPTPSSRFSTSKLPILDKHPLDSQKLSKPAAPVPLLFSLAARQGRTRIWKFQFWKFQFWKFQFWKFQSWEFQQSRAPVRSITLPRSPPFSGTISNPVLLSYSPLLQTSWATPLGIYFGSQPTANPTEVA